MGNSLTRNETMSSAAVEEVRTERARAIARGELRVYVMQWYLAANNQEPPAIQCENRRGHTSYVEWYLSPPLPGQNPVIIEEELGGSWTIRIEARDQKLL